MQRILIPVLVACCLAVLSACRKSSSSGSGDEPKISGKPSDAPVAIQPEWRPGNRYTMRLESTQTSDLNNIIAGAMGGRRGQQPADAAPVENLFAQEYTLVVTNAEDGNRGIEMEITAIELQVSRGDQQMLYYDSQNKAAPRDANPAVQMFDQLIGAKMHYLVSADNKVLKVEGLKELFDRVEGPAEAPGAAPDPQRRGRAMAGGVLRQTYNDEVFKQMIELSAGAPPAPVRVGEKWTVEREIKAPMLGGLVMVVTNTLRGWQERDGKRCARVDFSGTLTTKGEGDAGPMGMRLSIQDGRISGEYWFDPEIGLQRDTVIHQDYTMVVSGIAQRRNAGGADEERSVSAPVKQVVSVKLIEMKPVDG